MVPDDLIAATEARLRGWFPDFADRRWVLAVSGGRDSMALLRVMAQLVPARHLQVAHVNHGTRGPASDADEAFVRDQTGALGIEGHFHRVDGAGRSEAWLRDVRRAFLQRCVEGSGAWGVLTAHHGGDQWETLWLRLLRGTGVRGMGAIAPISPPFYRPWLGVSRRQIDRFVEGAGVSFREDATNGEDRFLRNRLRRGLRSLEGLQEAFGGAGPFHARLSAALEDLQSLVDWRDGEARAILAQGAVTPYWVRLPQQRLRELPLPLRVAVLEQMQGAAGGQGLLRPLREGWLRLLDAPRGRADGGQGVRLEVSCGQVFALPAVAPPPPRLLRVGGRILCGELGWEAQGEGAWLEGLEPRFFRPGDRWRGRKLKEWWLEARVPAPERPLMPLLAVPGDSQVAWVFPHRQAGISWSPMGLPLTAALAQGAFPALPAT